jgi:putative colanic acid biosynthesis glycosyltransferase
MISRVLQVNVRLSEGGAAGVARTLADALTARGIESPFAYGYGPHGQNSPLAEKYKSLRLTSAPVAALNRASYSLLGTDTPIVATRSGRRLKDEIARADVVHLHVLHSYMLSTSRLFQWLAEAGKPVVWTLHDQWGMTGRCAQPGTCRLWETGCQVCPNLHAYPPARIDFAAERWASRRRSIENLQSDVSTAVVACADWLGEEASVAGFQNVRVVKNSVDSEFFNEVTTSGRDGTSEKPRVMFICRDLRDPNKVDWPLLERLSSRPEILLTIVGDNAPTELEGVTRRASMNDRRLIARTFLEHDRLVFTSTVDYFPLTIVEALTAGVAVFAIRSRAAEEFATHPMVQIFETIAELELAVSSSKATTNPPIFASPSADAGFFEPSRMADDYVRIYEELIGRRQ